MNSIVATGANVPAPIQQEDSVRNKVAFRQDDYGLQPPIDQGELQMQPPLQQDEFSQMPVMYDTEAEAPKKSSFGIGNLLLGALAIGATATAIIKHKKLSGMQDQVNVATKAAEEAAAKAAEAEAKLTGLETKLDDLKPKHWWNFGLTTWSKIKKALFGEEKKIVEDVKKIADDVGDAAKDAADDVAGVAA